MSSRGLWQRVWAWAYLQGYVSRRRGIFFVLLPDRIRIKALLIRIKLKHPVKYFIINPILDKGIWTDVMKDEE